VGCTKPGSWYETAAHRQHAGRASTFPCHSTEQPGTEYDGCSSLGVVLQKERATVDLQPASVALTPACPRGARMPYLAVRMPAEKNCAWRPLPWGKSAGRERSWNVINCLTPTCFTSSGSAHALVRDYCHVRLQKVWLGKDCTQCATVCLKNTELQERINAYGANELGIV
jgi:hypothetical protein